MLNSPIRWGAYASFNALWAAAVQVHDELGRWLAERDRDTGRSTTFAAAKHIAAVATALERVDGVPRAAALDVAAEVVKASLCLSSGSAKKNRSEALAILELRPEAGPLAEAGRRSQLRMAFAEIMAIPVAEARRRRAARLAGACGGRPASRVAPTLALVRRLVQKASVDPQAAEELRLIRCELAI